MQVGYQRRFDAAFAAAKRAVDDGSLGALHTVRSTTMDPAPRRWTTSRARAASSGTARCTTSTCCAGSPGSNAVEVYATGSVQGDPLFAEYGDVDTAAVMVTFDGGALGVVSAARYNARGYDCRLEVHGFDDTVVAGWDQGVPVRNLDPSNDFPTGPAHHFFMDRFTEAFRTELAAFVEGGSRAVLFWAPRSPMRWRSRGSPRRPRSPCAGVPRSRSGGSSREASMKIAGAPISWGVCEVPGWGYQLTRTGCSPRCAAPD